MEREDLRVVLSSDRSLVRSCGFFCVETPLTILWHTQHGNLIINNLSQQHWSWCSEHSTIILRSLYCSQHIYWWDVVPACGDDLTLSCGKTAQHEKNICFQHGEFSAKARIQVPSTLFMLSYSLTLSISYPSITSPKSTLSKGYFRVDQILKMEICIIKSLRWHLNPPTSSIFLNIANPLICDACTMDPQASYEIAEISRYLLELSVCDGYFIDKSPSSVTCASILIAMEHLSTPDKTRRKFGSYKLDQKSPQVTELCVQRLRDVYNLAMPTQTEEVQEPPRAGSSPISVFNGWRLGNAACKFAQM